MKKKLHTSKFRVYLFLLITIFLLNSLPINAYNVFIIGETDPEHRPIVMVPTDPDDKSEGIQRGGLSPIIAYYYMEAIHFESMYDMGSFLVTIECTTTGDSWSKEIYLSNGGDYISILPNSGFYIVSLVSESGAEYRGEFTLD